MCVCVCVCVCTADKATAELEAAERQVASQQELVDSLQVGVTGIHSTYLMQANVALLLTWKSKQPSHVAP